ncbi:hypothetical protein ACLMNJ_27215 [Streptomyces seoulensis]
MSFTPAQLADAVREMLRQAGFHLGEDGKAGMRVSEIPGGVLVS